MTAKLFYRLVDAAAEKVYRAATVLGPAVGGALLRRSDRAEDDEEEGLWDRYHNAPYYLKKDGTRQYYD